MPPRALAVVLADRWHVPPWVVWEHPGVTRWLPWLNMVDALRNERAELDRKLAERQQGR